MKNICVVTGSRSEYGLLKPLMELIQVSPVLRLQIIVTGMHLSPEFGLTYEEIECDGFDIDYKVESLLSSDTPVGISKAIGLGVIGMADAISRLSPDLIMVLGDRYEVFAAVVAAMTAKIPVAHIHGGELTEGLIDEAIRHSITKMSHLHFVATGEYEKRVIQLGESPESVFLVGAMGIDSVKKLSLMSRIELQNDLNISFGEKNLVVTFHPVTLENNTSEIQVKELLSALDFQSNTNIFFTMPNADGDGRVIWNLIEKFVAARPNTTAFKSLGALKYLSLLSHVDAVVGNSSSGLIEMPSFKKGTINIGDRQKGRVMAKSIINCPPNEAAILKALCTLYSEKFQTSLDQCCNPYDHGGASEKIVRILENHDFSDMLKKRFRDISCS